MARPRLLFTSSDKCDNIELYNTSKPYCFVCIFLLASEEFKEIYIELNSYRDAMRSERRNYKRIYFSGDEIVTVNLSVPEISKKTIQARIMNLSEGGIAISYQRIHGLKIVQGEYLLINEVNGADGLEFIENKSVEVKWVLDNETFESIGVGCQFNDFNEVNKKEIKQFVELSENVT